MLKKSVGGSFHFVSCCRKRQGDAVLFHQTAQRPEIRVQDGIAARDIEVGQTSIDLAEIQAVVKSLLHLRPVHGVRCLAVILRKDIAVLASLVTLVRDVPLERKILHFVDLL